MARAPRILLVDDDDSGRAMLGLSLRQAGFLIKTAANGKEALELLADHDYGCLVTDAKMSAMSGFELAVQAARLRPKIKIAMISAIYSEKDIAGYPIEKFFPKPVALESLAAWLRAASAH